MKITVGVCFLCYLAWKVGSRTGCWSDDSETALGLQEHKQKTLKWFSRLRTHFTWIPSKMSSLSTFYTIFCLAHGHHGVSCAQCELLNWTNEVLLKRRFLRESQVAQWSSEGSLIKKLSRRCEGERQSKSVQFKLNFVCFSIFLGNHFLLKSSLTASFLFSK